MNCPKCGATIIKGDTFCKKCGNCIVEAAEYYEPDQQYRSRFVLFFKAWIGAAWGVHLRWLGYTGKADQLRKNFGWFGMKEIISAGIVGSLGLLLRGIFMYLIAMIYHCFICIAVIFGMYRKDADGHPIRYFKPKKVKAKKNE